MFMWKVALEKTFTCLKSEHFLIIARYVGRVQAGRVFTLNIMVTGTGGLALPVKSLCYFHSAP